MIAHESVVAVDLGKTRCRVAAWVNGRRIDAAGVGTPGLAAPQGVADAYASIVATMPDELRPQAIGVGAAGALAAPDAAQALAAQLSEHYGCPVAVASDVVTAHAGALAGESGVLLIAGTGAVALGVSADGVTMVDGWGPELGDFGSGAWIGRAGLQAVLRSRDGLGPNTSLTDRLVREIPTGQTPISWLSGAPDAARRCGTLAPAILFEAAAGDAVAGAIIESAVSLLAESASAAGERRVVLHGGLTDSDYFLPLLTAALDARGLVVVPPQGDALDGAAMIATSTELLHERAIHRAP